MSATLRAVRILGAAVFLGFAVSAPGQAASHAAPCSAAGLVASDAGTTSFGDRNVTKIDVINNSGIACSLSGYPQLQFSFLSGLPAPDLLNKTVADANYRTPPPTTIVLGSLRRARFLLGYPKIAANGSTCVPISNIQILLGKPGHYGSVNLPDTIAGCGIVNVSPFLKGS